ncbi:hypothetical protein HZS_3003 [Henneguya salminicola]|nr:hypothetical protein HZS_3003 [Henneguya salminicola]
MENEPLFNDIVTEVEKSCIAIRKRENIIDINKSDKVLLGILSSNSIFQYKIALTLINSKSDSYAKEFGAQLLYNSFKSRVSPEDDEIIWDWIDEIIPSIIMADSEILCQKLCKCLCLIILTSNILHSGNNPKLILEVIVKDSIEKKTDPDYKCVSFFTALSDEYNQSFLTKIKMSEMDGKIKQFVREVQAHSIKILNYEKNHNLKISVLRCIDSWIQNIISPRFLHFSLLSKIIENLNDPSLSHYAFTVIQSLLSNTNYDDDFIVSLGVLLTKNLIYIYPYLTLVEVNQLNELICESELQQNVLTLFISFSNLHLIKKIENESLIKEQTFSNSLKIMYRLTAVCTSFVSPYNQSPDLMIYPFQFWNNLFDNDAVKNNIKSPRFSYIFTELFYIFIQKITLFPWVIIDAQLNEIILDIRRQVSAIFKKMAAISPEIFLDNLYVTYKLYEQQCLKDVKKIYLIEAATFTLGSAIYSIPISHNSLVILKDIYGAIPSLCSANLIFIKPLLALLAKSSKFVIINLPVVFNIMIDHITNYIMKSQYNNSQESKEIIVSCIHFISRSMDQIDIQLNQDVSYKLIRLFGELFGLTFKKVKDGLNFDTFLPDSNKQTYISMAKIVVRALSCMYLDGRPNEAETYVSIMLKDSLELFEKSVLTYLNSPSPSLYKDIFLLTQLLREISQGLLLGSNSGKGGLKLIFEKFFNKSLIIHAYYCLYNSEVAIKLLIEIITKCIYKEFGLLVDKTSMANFVSYLMTLAYSNRWEIIPIFNTYIWVLRSESPSNMDPIDFVVVPLINEGLKNLTQPEWIHATIFFQFLIECFKNVPSNIMLYNYISLESIDILVKLDARLLVLKLLDYSTFETLPEVSKWSVKCLKRVIKCSFGSTDANILLLPKMKDLETISLIDHIFSFVFSRMVICGTPSVNLYYPIVWEINLQNSNEFIKVFHSTLFSETIIPLSLADDETKHSLYWQYIDNSNNKERGLELFFRFFSAISNKYKI